MPLRLRDNLYCCLCGERAIFLDADSGRYFCLSESLNNSFRSLWFGGARDLITGECLAPLLSQGIVCTTATGDEPIARSTLPLPTKELAAEPEFSIALWASIIIAQITAGIVTRRRRFAEIIRGIETRRRQARTAVAEDSEQRLRSIAAGFRVMDRMFRPKDRCLARSLAFLAVCNRYGIFPTLVIGVRTNPFVAHCWVQAGDCVLTGDYEQARLFVPLMAVP